MKKILLTVCLMVIIGITTKSYSQVNGCANGTGACDLIISGVEVSIVNKNCNYNGNPNQIEVIFDLKFKLQANSGNK